MRIKLNDIYRATLATHTGNEGWVGVEPHGRTYHVIVPVDTQIAKGVMACNRPTDGTPFGGYSNWIYMRCQPYDGNFEDQTLRFAQALKNIDCVVSNLSLYGIYACADNNLSPASQPYINTSNLHESKKLFCSSCDRAWNQPREVLDDPDLGLFRYRANVDDFNDGMYLFSHNCGGRVEVPVSVLIKHRRLMRSLAGSRACPGLCYHETVLSSCKALCEGSIYRKIAGLILEKRSRVAGS